MSLVTQKIQNLLSGVSQKPDTQRHPSQAQEQINGLSSIARGVMKRPPTKHLDQLTNDVTGWNDAFVHAINRDENERYFIVIANGEIFAYDAIDGTELTVISPEGTSYLADSFNAGYRAVTVGDTTIIVNRDVVAEQRTDKSPVRFPEALVHVRQADFSTYYAITLDGIMVSLRTLDMDSPAARASISTESIAKDLYDLLLGDAVIAARFALQRFGSTIWITPITPAQDFLLGVQDGLGDQGLKVVKGAVQSFEDLPPRAPKGFIAQVSGAVDTSKDDYWVEYDDLGSSMQQGVWREVVKPNTLLGMDKTTLPHQLKLMGSLGVDRIPHQGLPSAVGAVFDTAAGATTSLVDWDEYFDSVQTLSIAPGFGGTAIAHDSGFRYTAVADSKRIRVAYDLDSSALPPGISAFVSLHRDTVLEEFNTHTNSTGTGGSRDPLDFGGGSIPGRYVLFFDDLLDGEVVELKVRYSTGGTPPVSERVALRVAGQSIELTGGFSKGVQLTSPPGGVYPEGTEIVVNINSGGDIFTYTVIGGPETAAEVVEAISDLIDADADYASTFLINTAFKEFYVNRIDGAAFTLAISSDLDSGLTFHNLSLALTPDEHIGSVIQNHTDGSGGIITSNTDTTVTVTSLTGGGLNIFSIGDLCSIVGDDAEIYFVFESIPWKDRGAGDTDVVTFPSFTDSPISDVFFYQNRLGFLSKENIVFSSSGDLFNIFRYTATDLRPDDMIDVRSAYGDLTLFDSAFLWNEALYIKSDNAWFNVSGEPALTPSTVRLDPVGKFLSSKDPKPVVLGDRVYFTRAKTGNTQVFEMSLAANGATAQAFELTKDIPTYIEGSPLEMVGDSAEGILVLLTDANSQQNLYIFKFFQQDGERVLSSWSRWEFADGTVIVGLALADGILGIIRKHDDGAYVETMDFDLSPDPAEKVAYLDRRCDAISTPSGVLLAGQAAVFASGATTWTLPYSIATDGSEGDVVVANSTTGAVYTSTRPSATTVRVAGANLTTALVYIGQRYLFKYVPSTLFVRDRNDLPTTRGRLQLRNSELFYVDTTDFTVTVSPVGKTAINYTVNLTTPADGKLRVPIKTRNTEVLLEITNNTPGPCALSELDWEGWFTSRDREI